LSLSNKKKKIENIAKREGLRKWNLKNNTRREEVKGVAKSELSGLLKENKVSEYEQAIFHRF